MIMRLQHQRPDGEIDTYHLKPGRRYHIGRGSSCEVRILDLKLSRKHCAVEFTNGTWMAVDLMSTNGCKLDGEQIVGSLPVRAGSRIEAGQTVLTVAGIDDAADAEPTAAAGAAAAAEDAAEPAQALEQEPLPEGESNAAAAAESKSYGRDDKAEGGEWEPEAETDALVKTDALIPNRPGLAKPGRPITASHARRAGAEPRRPTAVFRSEDLKVGDDQDNEQTQLNAPRPPGFSAPPQEAPPIPAAVPLPGAGEDRTFYITVLGRRVGPLTRSAARELKARELKGTLTTSDLEQYPLS
jgi:hypothetical protein